MPASSRPARTPRAEQVLIDHLHEALGERPVRGALCTTLARGQAAGLIAARFPQCRVVCHTLDRFVAERGAALQDAAIYGEHPGGEDAGRFLFACTPDPPPLPGGAGERDAGDSDGEPAGGAGEEVGYDLAALPTSMRGEAELTRDLLQLAHIRLADGGRLVASTDNPQDRWLHAELGKLFDKVTVIAEARGVAYAATKHGPLRKAKNFAAEFKVRDGGRLLSFESRPGVFSHRRIDPGARALIESIDVAPGTRVLDLGCGSGVVTVAAAVRAGGVTVEAVDSNPRAIECTARNAAANGVGGAVRTTLTADARSAAPGTFDLAAGNPPYFSHFKIAELFLTSAREALKKGGRVVIVTKRPDWFGEAMAERFADVEVEPVRRYHVVRGVKH